MTDFDWGKFVAEEEIIVVMRFSFFGRSGWKSGFSADPALLFEETRLKRRFALLRALPLPSLAAQTDKNFRLFVLCSKEMPDWAHGELRKACKAFLPSSRFEIVKRPYGSAQVYLRQFLVQDRPESRAIQIMLDDDDALSNDFIAAVRAKMSALSPPSDRQLRFVSFAHGYALDLNEANAVEPALFQHRYPFINLGLAMAGRKRGPNLLSISHRSTPKKHEHVVIRSGDCMFVRSLHGLNDSRVAVQENWPKVADWRTDAAVSERFAFLSRF